jgi:hypothetical protein
MTVNLTMAQANQTIATLPARFVEMIYTTASSAPDEVKRGYFILTATNATSPNLGITKGYAVFYEGNSSTSSSAAATPQITRTTAAASAGSLAPVPLPLPVKHVFDSFELIVAPEVEQAILQQQASVGKTGGGITTTTTTTSTTGGGTTGGGDLNCEDITERNFPIDPNNDPNGFDGDNDGIGCETGAFGEVIEPETGGGGENVGEDDDDGGDDEGGDLDECVVVGGPSGDDCDFTPDDGDGDGVGDGDGDADNEGGEGDGDGDGDGEDQESEPESGDSDRAVVDG